MIELAKTRIIFRIIDGPACYRPNDGVIQRVPLYIITRCGHQRGDIDMRLRRRKSTSKLSISLLTLLFLVSLYTFLQFHSFDRQSRTFSLRQFPRASGFFFKGGESSLRVSPRHFDASKYLEKNDNNGFSINVGIHGSTDRYRNEDGTNGKMGISRSDSAGRSGERHHQHVHDSGFVGEAPVLQRNEERIYNETSFDRKEHRRFKFYDAGDAYHDTNTTCPVPWVSCMSTPCCTSSISAINWPIFFKKSLL